MYENDASHLPQQLSTFAAIGWTDNKGVPNTPQLWFRRADPLEAGDAEKIVAFMRELHRNAYGTDRTLTRTRLLRDAERAQRNEPALGLLRLPGKRGRSRAGVSQILLDGCAGRGPGRRVLHRRGPTAVMA